MKKLLLLMTILLPMVASANPVEINGIYYNLGFEDRTAAVVSNPNNYSGSVEIPATVEYENVTYSVVGIGYRAFYHCTGLTSLTIPNSVTIIGMDAFSGCSNLVSVNITDLEAWCRIQFVDCLDSSSNPLNYAHHLFLNGEEIKDLVIPNSVTSIGESAFEGCTGLTSVTISNNVTSIGGEAFLECSGLTSVTISNSVTSIGEGAFARCTGLTSITIPSSVTSIGEGAFFYCIGLTSVKITDLEAWCRIQFNGRVSNPLSIAHHLFLNGKEMKKLVIPNSVTSLGDRAFEGCSALTSVTIPNSVKSVGVNTFMNCSRLTSITVPNSVTSIGEGAFLGCTGLTSIIIPNSMTSIAGDTFNGCSRLTSVDIPGSVTSIGNYAFRLCSGLTSISIPNSVTSIGSGAFSGCTGLTSITVPNSVTSIGHLTFCDCTGLTSVTIPNSVTSIGSGAFSGCTGLTSITVPNSVTSIGLGAFYNCAGLTSVNIIDLEAWLKISFDSSSNPLEYAHHLFLNGEEIKNLVIPNGVTSIGDWAFGGCTGLTSTTIPNSVTSIGNSSFWDCSNLVDVYCFAENPPTTEGYTFYNTPIAQATLHVLGTSVNLYKETDIWKDFGTIVGDAVVTGVAHSSATPVLIQSNGGFITVQGADDGTLVSIFNTAGQQAGSAISNNGRATVFTTLAPGTIAIVKIGTKSVKVVIK